MYKSLHTTTESVQQKDVTGYQCEQVWLDVKNKTKAETKLRNKMRNEMRKQWNYMNETLNI